VFVFVVGVGFRVIVIVVAGSGNTDFSSVLESQVDLS
jgi:hypothetical protein